LHLAEHVDEYENQQERRCQLQQQLRQEVRLLRRTSLDRDVGLLQRADQGGVVGLRIERLELSLVLAAP